MEKDTPNIKVHLLLISTPGPTSALRTCTANFNSSSSGQSLSSFENYSLEIAIHRHPACFKNLPSPEVTEAETASTRENISIVLSKHRERAAPLWRTEDGREGRSRSSQRRELVRHKMLSASVKIQYYTEGRIFIKTKS